MVVHGISQGVRRVGELGSELAGQFCHDVEQLGIAGLFSDLLVELVDPSSGHDAVLLLNLVGIADDGDRGSELFDALGLGDVGFGFVSEETHFDELEFLEEDLVDSRGCGWCMA